MKTLVLYAMAVMITLSTMGKPAESGAVPGEWTMDFEAARKVANEKKLPLFINFTGSDWCTWCKHMDKEVFAKQEWKEYAEKSLMLVWIDFPKDKTLVPEKYRERNRQLALTFEVKGYPTYIVLDDNGKDELGQIQAEQQITPATFINKLKPILIERAECMQKLIAGMPKKEGAELKKSCDERAALRREINDLQKQMQEKGGKLREVDSKIEQMRTQALEDKLTPAQAEKYQAAKKELADKEKALKEWMDGNPPQNQQNREKYMDMSGKVNELKSKINELLYAQ